MGHEFHISEDLGERMGPQTAGDINIYINIYDCVSASAVQKKKWERVRGKEGVRVLQRGDESVWGVSLGVCRFGVCSWRKGCVLVPLFIKNVNKKAIKW